MGNEQSRKKRVYPTRPRSSARLYSAGGSLQLEQFFNAYPSGEEVLQSKGNTLWWLLKKYGNSSIGVSQRKWMAALRIDAGNGGFTLDRTRRTPLLRDVNQSRRHPTTGQRYTFKGDYQLAMANSVLQAYSLQDLYWPSESQLTSLLMARGGTAINNTLPMQEQSNLGLALAEILREGLPKMIALSVVKSERGGLTQTIGGEFLNYQFGIAPLISDLRSLLQAVLRANKYLYDFHNRHDKHYRRRFTFPDTRENISKQVNSAVGTTPSSGWVTGASSSPLMMHRHVEQKTWFSGAYLYAAATQQDGLMDRLREFEESANHLLGTRLTPELLWNLTPWTWLIDWFVTISDVVSNISRLGRDGLVLEYGYIMQSTYVRAEFTTPNIYSIDGQVIGEQFEIERKARRRASPYGFGLSPSSLTDKQWAILGALGMTKGPRSLW